MSAERGGAAGGGAGFGPAAALNVSEEEEDVRCDDKSAEEEGASELFCLSLL